VERLPDRLMVLMQEKTKRKLMKEKNLLPIRTEGIKSLLPSIAKKKDFLTVSLAVHVAVH
jgi:hypothetical protein